MPLYSMLFFEILRLNDQRVYSKIDWDFEFLYIVLGELFISNLPSPSTIPYPALFFRAVVVLRTSSGFKKEVKPSLCEATIQSFCSTSL